MANRLLLSFFISLIPITVSAQADTLFRIFTVTQTNQGVLVSFTVRGGVTCSGVQIERASDSVNFVPLYEFVGVCGNLDYDESYTFTDHNPVANRWSQYRLEIGSLGIYSTLRNIRYLDYGTDGISVFPVPCRNDCALYFKNDNKDAYEGLIYDISGRRVLIETTNSNEWRPDTRYLKSGLYFYQILRNSEVRFTGKLLIF